MKNRNILLGLCALALVLPGLAAADDYNGRRLERGRYVFARVIKVQPVIRYVTVKVPVQECWDERRTGLTKCYDFSWLCSLVICSEAMVSRSFDTSIWALS